MAHRSGSNIKRRKMDDSDYTANGIHEASVDEEDGKRKGSYLCRILDLASNISDNEANVSPLASLANLATEKEAALEIVNAGVAKKLGPLLSYKDLTIQDMISGIFRNLSTSGGVDVCLSLVRSGILLHMRTALKEDTEKLQISLRENNLENQELVANCLKNLVALLWNLCEASDHAVKLFNEGRLISHLISLFNTNKRNSDLDISLAQCLGTVTEDNEDAMVCLLNEQPSIDKMMQLLLCFDQGSKQLHLACTISGVFMNMCQKLEEGQMVEISSRILKIIAYALDVPCEEQLKVVAANSVTESKIEDFLHLLSSKQTSLEILANMICIDVLDEGDAMEVSDDNCSMDDVSFGDEKLDEPNSLQRKLKSFLSTTSVTQNALRCIRYPWLPELIVLKEKLETEKVLQALARIQQSALVCLANLIDNDICSDEPTLQILWKEISVILCSRPGIFDATESELARGLTGMLRAIAVVVAEEKCQNFLDNENNLVKMVKMWHASTSDDQVKCNLLKIFGAIGKIYSKHKEGKTYLQEIALVLMAELTVENKVILITEALDATFDTFGEDGLPDEILLSSGLDTLLCNLATKLKAKVKGEKFLSKDQKILAHSARINLNRFISYKKSKT